MSRLWPRNRFSSRRSSCSSSTSSPTMGLDIGCFRGSRRKYNRRLLQPLQSAGRDDLAPREQRPGILAAMQRDRRVVRCRLEAPVEILVAGDVAQVRQFGAQLAQQGEQGIDLLLRVRDGEGLIAAVAPMRIASDVGHLDADRARVVACLLY